MNNFQQLTTFIIIPFVLAVPPILGWLIGRWLDKTLGTHHYLTYFLLVCGVVAGARECYRIIKRFSDE